MTDEDRRLREAMARAHRADRAPPFSRTWARRSPRAARSSLRPLVVLCSGLGAFALAGVWVVARTPPRPSPPVPAFARWVAPTDFLLQTPDLVTLRTLPSLVPAGDPLLSPPHDGRRETR